jgi:cytochrome P450
VTLDLPSSTRAADLYDAYAALRSSASPVWSERQRAFLVARHADVSTCLTHPAFSSAIAPIALAGLPGAVAGVYRGVLQRQLDLLDPPRHTALRQLLLPAFGAQQLEHLHAFVKAWLAERLRGLGSRFDLIREIAEPLPLAVLDELLGLPAGRRADAQRQAAQFVGALAEPAACLGAASAALEGLQALLEEALTPSEQAGAGLLACLRAAAARGFMPADLLANTILILAAGHRTTTNLIGNATWLLLKHPEQRAAVTERDAWPSAIEESLRCESPVQTVRRVCAAASRLGGQELRAGDVVLLVLGAANRDASVFEHADRFVALRSPNRHLAFAAGAHFCLGAQLARLQAQAVLAALFARGALRALEPDPHWIDSRVERGVERLLVEWP